MKNCDHYINQFSELLDDTITPTKKQYLQEHLQECPDCQDQLSDLRGMKKSLGSLPRLQTSATFDTILYAKIRQEERFKRSRDWSFFLFELSWKKAPVYAMAAIFLMFLGAQVQRFSTPQTVSSFSKSIAVENVLNGEINIIDPGYLVVSDVDSTKNTVRVVNYPNLDRAATIDEYQKSRAQLPDLKEAPDNRARVTQTSQFNQPQIRQAEFVF